MPDNFTDCRTEPYLLWLAAEGRYNELGEQMWFPPVSVYCRTEFNNSLIFDREGNRHTVDSELNVDRDIPIQSLYHPGTLADFDIDNLKKLYEVVRFEKIPDLDGLLFDRWVSLKYYKGNLDNVLQVCTLQDVDLAMLRDIDNRFLIEICAQKYDDTAVLQDVDLALLQDLDTVTLIQN